MGAPHVVLQADQKALKPISTTAPLTAWRALGRGGVVLALIASVDILLRWYPLSLRSPEWELGTVALTFASMPLVTVGLVAGLASALARGARTTIAVMAGVFCATSVFVIGSLLLFASDVPIALGAVSGPSIPPGAALEMKKTIARAAVMGAGFAVIYVYGSVVSVRYLLRRIKDA